MVEKVIRLFKSAVHNVLSPEIIPEDAAKDSQNFVTKDGRVVLVGGRAALGAEGTVGPTTSIHVGYKVNGDKVFFAKFGTIIKYFDGSAWQNSITGLDADHEYTLQNYSSLAGTFVYVNGPGGYWKIVTANPGSPIDIYDAARNFKGYIVIDRGRTLLWNRDSDKTGFYGSWIDRQNSTVYTTVTNEAIGASGSTNYTGSLAFKGSNATASCFGVTFEATVAAGTETFTDNYTGVLTSNLGGTGTINYATGAYNITFSAVTTGAVTSDYQWENSNDNGISDFTKSATRLAGEGFQFPQDEGGDAILNVLIGQDGAYYSLKEQSAYRLSIDADDLGADNEVYRKEMGLPFFRAAISTSKGIMFMNTANPSNPELTILQKNKFGDNVEPFVLFPQFKFGNYNYDSCVFGVYDRWTLIFCKSQFADNNDTILLCDADEKKVDPIKYSGNGSVQDAGVLYVADSITHSVYKTFNGFDDLGSPVQAFWSGKDQIFSNQLLTKLRRLRFKGFIDPDQAVGVYINTDQSGYTKVGTILGNGTYVNYSEVQAIGSNYIGQSQIGGDDIVSTYGYYMELKVRTGKFRSISVKLIPEGIGYFDFELMTFWDLLFFESRIPKAYREKQNVSLDGTQTNQ